MTEHDVLVGFRLRLFTLAEELGNVSAACRAMGVHRSTYYRLKRKVDRWGLEALQVRERRRPRMPNEIGPHLEQRIVAFALGHPGLGPQADLGRAGQGEVGRDPDLRARRLAGAAAGRAQHPHQAPGADRPPPRPLRAQAAAAAAGAAHRRHRARREGPARLLLRRPAVGHQGHRLAVHGDRRRLRLRLGRAADLGAQPPRPPHPRAAAPRRPRAQGRRLEARARSPPTTARSSARGSSATRSTQLGARQRFIKAGRPNSNGCVERLQLTILEECWRPAFARSLVPKMTALQRDLDEYLHDYNFDRAHTGRLTKGRVPADIVFGARKTRPVR